MSLPIKLILKDLNSDLVAAWDECFRGITNVQVRDEDFFSSAADAVVSPANSFGYMDGGLDLLISNTLPEAERAVQARIMEKHHGEMPVGCAEVIGTFHKQWPYLVCAPTMRVPENISHTINPYLAMRACLLAVLNFNKQHGNIIETLVVPGLGTGVGRVTPERCAAQMKIAYENVSVSPSIPGFRAIHAGHIRLLQS